MDKFPSSFIYMSLVSLIYWIYVASASSYVLSNLIQLSLHVCEITSVEFWRDASSSLALFSSIFSSLILVIDSVSVSFFKVTSSFDEILVRTLIRGRFYSPITLSLLYVFVLFDLLLLVCEVTVIHLLFLEIYKIFLPCFLLDNVNSITIHFNFVMNCLCIILIRLEYW